MFLNSVNVNNAILINRKRIVCVCARCSLRAGYRAAHNYAFTDVGWNFDKMQIIFKATTGSSGRAFW